MFFNSFTIMCAHFSNRVHSKFLDILYNLYCTAAISGRIGAGAAPLLPPDAPDPSVPGAPRDIDHWGPVDIVCAFLFPIMCASTVSSWYSGGGAPF